jgi:hypothetical protein
MLGKMERDSTQQKYPVSTSVQNRIIKHYARNELRSLQDIRPTNSAVPSLYDIAYYFGVWSKSKVVKNGLGYIRIELSYRNLTIEAMDTVRDLLSHGIFIDGGFSNMSSGETARKLLFRRIYTPAFPTTFNDDGNIPMREKSFRDFIRNPRDFVRARMSEDLITPEEQQTFEQLDLDDEL